MYEKQNELTKESYRVFSQYVREILWEEKNGHVTKHPKNAHNGDVDAFRHVYSVGIIAMEYNGVISNILGQTYELNGQINNDARYYANLLETETKKFNKVQKPEEYSEEMNMELWNNRIIE